MHTPFVHSQPSTWPSYAAGSADAADHAAHNKAAAVFTARAIAPLYTAGATTRHKNPYPIGISDDTCARASIQAADEMDIPFKILWTISLIESARPNDRHLRAWPWAINIAGHGMWFDTQHRAQKYVLRTLKTGHANIDIGCFQINYRWHNSQFKSIKDMFNPLKNARYAAKFLKQLHCEHGTWDKAIRAYHSRTPHFADRYQKRFEAMKAKLPANIMPPLPRQQTDLFLFFDNINPIIQINAPRDTLIKPRQGMGITPSPAN